MERLKAFSVEKFTLDVRKFHTLTFKCGRFNDFIVSVTDVYFICDQRTQ